ncbi:site-specific integrase [Phytohabitans sp. ZYX-F-186]|uniref:Site-specific integrase n=1 Tax=Phytohabitans maris TaxID=3071409 RepID=A0ABU0ZUQ8_9ACTN|nr:site-specific integrase [Phytohabitans sp. ZYX-F-186]MDQ7910770.1 site-specific integrase [Phytohabitans sp. ZYX-F-186]
MAWIRQLPSKKWAATVYLPNGKRVTRTHDLKSIIAGWAADLEADIRHGDWIDPRAGSVTVGEWWDRCQESRRLELASRRRDASHWRCHVAPHWAEVRIGSILRPDVSAWVVKMQRAGVGGATIEGAVGVLRALLDLAVDAKVLRLNAARGVSVPPRATHLDRVLEPGEDEQLLSALDRHHPGLPAARLFVEVLVYCGLRWEEAAAIDREHVVMRRALIQVGPVVERDGTIRPYPKTPAGVRDVPVDDELWPRLRAHALATAPGGLLFTAGGGQVLHYPNWRERIWRRALTGTPALEAKRGRAARLPMPGAGLEHPWPTAHDLRHTYGTRLAEQGVPAHEIAALMGHESLRSVQRYLHAGSDRFDRARQATRRARRAGGAA